MNSRYLLTPFLNTATRGQQNYNFSHIRTRTRVENLFGIWKRRFPIMAYGCRLSLPTTQAVIISTAVLHNLARLNGEPEPPMENDVLNHELQVAINEGEIPQPLPINNVNNLGYDQRNYFVNNYFNF